MTDAETEEVAAVIARYDRFARDEAPGRSELYGQWAAGVAASATVAAVLARIPAQHRQPPLVFAVTRMLGAPESAFDEWENWLVSHASAVVRECSRRMLQTNEPLRCAALLPALSLVDGPIALIEIGASAGLCMIPDAYSYEYSGHRLDPVSGPSAVVLSCEVVGPAPLRMPHIAWRVGIDLAPLDAADDADRRFLASLVWPGEDLRLRRIGNALDAAASRALRIVAGDATDPDVLQGVLSAAPADATVVVTMPGVLPHIPRGGRERLAQALRAADVRWVSIEPSWMREPRMPPPSSPDADFVLVMDDEPLAWVDPLGARVEWRTASAESRR